MRGGRIRRMENPSGGSPLTLETGSDFSLGPNNSNFALDTQGLWPNNKVNIIANADLYLLAVLNSRVMWWLMSRHFVHMKDEALALDVSYLERLPIPELSEELKDRMRAETQELLRLTSAGSWPVAELLNRER